MARNVEKMLTVNRKYLTRIEQLEQLSEQEKVELEKVTENFAFRSNDYYLSLIYWVRIAVFNFVPASRD